MTSLPTGLPETALALVQANCNRVCTSLCYINFSAENFRYHFFFCTYTQLLELTIT